MNKKRIETLLIIFLIVISLVYFVIDFSILAVLVLVVSCILLKFSYPLEGKKENEKLEKVEEKKEAVIEEKEEDEEPEEVSIINYPDDFDEKNFLKEAFLLYKNVQTDFMNFEYDNLMHSLGIDMYNQYSKQMKSLQERNKQAVRVNINLDKIQTESFIQDKDCYKAVINMAISEDKYMKGVDEEFRLTSARVRYESCYSITLIKRHKKKIVRKCHNCNEKIQGNPYKCPLCDSMLLETTDNWIMVDLKLLCSHSKKGSLSNSVGGTKN